MWRLLAIGAILLFGTPAFAQSVSSSSQTIPVPVSTANGGLGAANGSANGVPVFNAGTSTVTAATGTGSPVLGTGPQIGGAATLAISSSVNSAYGGAVTNANAGGTASAIWSASNGTNTAQFGQEGIGTANSGALLAASTFIFGPSSPGLSLVSQSGVIALGSLSTITAEFDPNTGHWITGGSAPTAGTGAASVAGNDVAFNVTVGSAVTSATVNFGHTWASIPKCIVSSNSVASIVDVASVSTTAITFGASVALTGAVLTVHCLQ